MKKPSNKSFFEKRGASKASVSGDKVPLPGGGGGRLKKFNPKYNFVKIKEKFEALGTLDLEDFNSAADIGLFLDWYNKSLKDHKADLYDALIHDMTVEIVKYEAPVPAREVEHEMGKVDKELKKKELGSILQKNKL